MTIQMSDFIPWKLYDPRVPAGRLRFLWLLLYPVVAMVALVVLMGLTTPNEAIYDAQVAQLSSLINAVLYGGWLLAIARRLKDCSISRWYFLSVFIPFLGVFIMIGGAFILVFREGVKPI